jgi:hypothetical protein
MVQVVLVLPPSNAKPLADVAEENACCVVQGTLLEDLVVQKVMGQPATLLPEQRLRSASPTAQQYLHSDAP